MMYCNGYLTVALFFCKICHTDYSREINEAIDGAIDNEAVTPYEIKSLKLNLNRLEGMYNHNDNPPPDATITRKQAFDCFCMYALTCLFAEDRGVMVVTKRNESPKFGYPAVPVHPI